MRTIWVLLVVAACSSSGEDAGQTGDRPAPPPPLRVEFGDCALPAAAFVSGPRPMPFAFDKSDAKVAAAGTQTAARSRRSPAPAISRRGSTKACSAPTRRGAAASA